MTTDTPNDPLPLPSSPSKVGGWVLIAGSLLAIGFMLYHPTIRAKGLHDLVDEFAKVAFVNALVHGALIALMCVIVLGFSYLSDLLGWNRPLVRAGFIAYAVGTAAMIAAALVSGFITPTFVANFQWNAEKAIKASGHDHAVPAALADATPNGEIERLKSMLQIMGLSRSVNQVCSRVGVFASAMAYLFWSLSMLRQTGAARWVGIYGTLAAGVLSVSLLSGYLPMGVHGMLAFVGCQASWSVAAGWLMLTGRI